ncbi:MAG: SHOCT domain-containing protein [Acidimicrobiales bacterium]
MMVFAAEFGTGQVLWSIFWFFLFFMFIWLVISVFGDIIRSDDMGGVAKAVWVALIVFLPYLGVFAYLVVRGGKMGERQLAAARAQEQAVASYIRETAGGGTSTADQLATLAELHTSGKLDDAEYATAKARVISA